MWDLSVVRTSETLVYFKEITRCYIPESCHFHIRHLTHLTTWDLTHVFPFQRQYTFVFLFILAFHPRIISTVNYNFVCLSSPDLIIILFSSPAVFSYLWTHQSQLLVSAGRHAISFRPGHWSPCSHSARVIPFLAQRITSLRK